MSYIENPFKVGQYVICVNDNFPVVETTGDKSQIGNKPITFPKKGEITTVVKLTPKYMVEYGWIERDKVKVSPLVDKFDINWKGFENLQILFEMKG